MTGRQRGTATDAHGNFALELPSRQTQIEVKADGYFDTEIDVPPELDSLRIALASGGVIAGSYSRLDGSGVFGNASIEPLAEDFFVPVFWGGGRFRSGPLPDGEYRVGLASGAGAVESRTVVIEDGRSVEDVRLIVQPHDGRLAGRITGLLPQQKAFLEVRDRTGREAHGHDLGDGEYALRGVPPVATVTAQVWTPSAVTRLVRRVRLDDQGEATLDFDFSARSCLEGVVRAAGRPLGDVRVVVTPEDRSQPMASATTTELGQYMVRGLADGRHVVRALGQSFDVEVAGQSEFDLALPHGSVHGTARLTATGAFAVGAAFQLTRVEGDRQIGAGMSQGVASDGTFRFQGLAKGEYLMEALGYYRIAQRRFRLGQGETLELSLEVEER